MRLDKKICSGAIHFLLLHLLPWSRPSIWQSNSTFLPMTLRLLLPPKASIYHPPQKEPDLRKGLAALRHMEWVALCAPGHLAICSQAQLQGHGVSRVSQGLTLHRCLAISPHDTVLYKRHLQSLFPRNFFDIRIIFLILAARGKRRPLFMQFGA